MNKRKDLFGFIIWIIVAIILWRTVIPLGKLARDFPLNDFSVYLDGTKAALSGENPYGQKYFDRFNYPPAAAVVFIPLTFLSVNTAEGIFTGLSILSVWLTVDWTLKILKWKPDRSVKWLVFALCLKMFPVKLTLALGQINLIILALVVGAFYFCEARLPRAAFGGPRNDGRGGGILLGLATALKLTPAPILIYFLIRKEWKIIKWSIFTILVLTAAGGLVFGWDLTRYYFTSVLPGLMGEVTKETLNVSYMNQSVTALLARVGIFGSLNSLIRLTVSGLLLSFILIKWISLTKITKVYEKHEPFLFFWSLVVISILFLPVFVWQHHYVFLLPAWIILLHSAVKNRKILDWVAVGISYGLLNFYFKDVNWLAGKNPLIISHFLVTALIIWFMTIRHPERSEGSRRDSSADVTSASE